jgi:DNA/RNA-binding domain of Phe-tRNA-synthetase-like protein
VETTGPVTSCPAGVALGWMLAEGCDCGPSPVALGAEVRASCERAVAARESERSAARRAAVRDLLRHGAYKPTGRGKPASEYLLNAAAEGQFPLISAAVDINNLVSLESLLPISVVDLDLAGTDRFLCRWGRAGETYVFNPSGQILGLRDLLLVAREPHDEPCATPVKDSQATKTRPETRRVLGVVYAPEGMSREAEWAAARMSDLFATHCGAKVRWGLVLGASGAGAPP